MQNNYFYKWIDSNKDDEINSFKECIDSYIYFKKDAFYKTNKLIKKKPEFNAPKLLKIVLLLFSRDVQKISLARETFKSISTDEVNDYFHQYLEIVNLWIKNDLKNLLNKLELIIKDNPKDIFAIRLFHFNNIFLGIDSKFLNKHEEILSKWSENDQHYNLLLGMTSYAFEENNIIDKAKLLALNSLKALLISSLLFSNRFLAFTVSGRPITGCKERMDKLKDYAEYFKNQHILPFIDYHLIFYYLYYNDQDYFQQLEERMEENYLENSFKENYINYLKPIIHSMKTNVLLNENIIKSQFKYLGGSFAQRELIFLSLIQNTKYEKNKSDLISEYNDYKSVSKLYV